MPLVRGRYGRVVRCLSPQAPTSFGKDMRAITRPVVSQDPRDAHTLAAVITQGRNQRGNRAGASLIRLDREPADAAVIVDGDVDIIPARTMAGMPAVAGPS